MAGVTDAGPRTDSVRVEAVLRDTRQGWANVRPLERGVTGAVGQWIDLLASISHELRTPLNAVIGFSDAMHQEVFGPIGNARYREYVSHIRTSGVELLQAAEDALAMTAVLAQPKAVSLDDVALAPIVASALEELAATSAARDITTVVEIADGLEVRGDHRILPRAIRQLAAVALSRAAPGAGICVRAAAEHGLVELSIEVSEVSANVQPLAEHRAPEPQFELGLGRRELAMWLATALLDLLDCRLEADMRDGVLTLRTSLEQSSQHSFFTETAQRTA